MDNLRTNLRTNGFFKNMEIRKPLVLLVARGGIEPPTHGFSVRFKLFSLTTTGLYQLLLTVE